ncbi:MAG: right-handed parallel beta-helix repeat-containing protein, partial [bacterium]
MSRWPGQSCRIGFQWVVILIVSVAAVSAPSPLMAQTVIRTNTTLTADHVGEIVIGTHGVILDCSGRRISGGTAGITLNGKTGVTVKNCVVSNTVNGIVLSSSSGNTFEANTVEGNAGGFHLTASGGNTFKGNIASRHSQFGFRFEGFSTGNNLRENTIANNARGIDVVLSSGNFIINNNFLDNQIQATVSGPSAFFSFGEPTGGNYWSDFDTSAEGCSDQNSDGFCDAPKVFAGGRDNLPWTKRFGQSVTTVVIDIKPGSGDGPAPINLRARGTIPVVILSTSSFDASTVDLSTVKLAGAGVALKNNGTPQASLEDVNGDGRPDLVVHVETEALDIKALNGYQTGTLTLEG